MCIRIQNLKISILAVTCTVIEWCDFYCSCLLEDEGMFNLVRITIQGSSRIQRHHRLPGKISRLNCRIPRQYHLSIGCMMYTNIH